MCLPFRPRQFGLLFHIKRVYIVFVFYMYIYCGYPFNSASRLRDTRSIIIVVTKYFQ